MSTPTEVKQDSAQIVSLREQLAQRLYADLQNDAGALAGVNDKLGLTGSVDESQFVQSFVKNHSHLSLEPFWNAVAQACPTALPNTLRWDLTPPQISALVADIISSTRSVEDAVAAVPKGQHTFANTIGALADCSRVAGNLAACATFPGHVSSDAKLRDACTEAEKALRAFAVESNMREDVYLSLKAFSQSAEAKALQGEPARLLEHAIRDYERNGLHLPLDKRDKIKAIQQQLAQLGVEFAKNLSEENVTLQFSKEELAGLPEDFLTRVKNKDDDKFTLSLKYPDYFPVMKLCKVEDTRKKMEFAFNTRCMKENTPILETMIKLRHEKALLLGFPNHASFVLDIRMAKSPEQVLSFLTDLNAKLDPLVKKEMEVMLSLKEAEMQQKQTQSDNIIHNWDSKYYSNLVEEKYYDVDHEKIKEYFPFDVVRQGLFDIYQTLLGLKFEQRETKAVWHDEVVLYDVKDASNGSLVGQFYLDLHPRQGKYGHAAVFNLVNAAELPASSSSTSSSTPSRQLPVGAMVANFSRASESKPALLDHNEVVTFFHEFGHVMHHICSFTQYSEFAGLSVERDFVEAPSQMLENWCWEAESLKQMSGHYLDNSKKLPDDLASKLIASRLANVGLFNKRQIAFGLFDQRLHTSAEADTAKVFEQVQSEVSPIPVTPGTNFAASFGHLAGGYDAQYYGYMWSEVFSMDMFQSRFKKEGVMNPKVGSDYRREILAAGYSRDSIESLRAFLGREPSNQAFLVSKGLQ